MFSLAASLALFGAAGCGLGSDGETAETQAPQTVVVVSEVPAPTAAPTVAPTNPPQTVVVVQQSPQAPRTVVSIVERDRSSGGSVSGASGEGWRQRLFVGSPGLQHDLHDIHDMGS